MTVGPLAAATAVVALALSIVVPGLGAPDVPLVHPDTRALAEAGWGRGLRWWIALQAVAVATCGAACAMAGVPPILGVGGALVPSIAVRLRAEAALERTQRAIAPIVTTAEAALRSGLALPDALRRAAEASMDDAAARPIRAAVQAFDLGASLDDALVAAAGSTRDPRADLALSTLALGIGERLPRERLADLLGAVGERLSFEQRLGDEVRARAAGARQQQRLLAALVPGLAIYLAITMPVLGTTLASDLGRFVLLPAASALEILGIVLGRRIVRGALER